MVSWRRTPQYRPVVDRLTDDKWVVTGPDPTSNGLTVGMQGWRRGRPGANVTKLLPTEKSTLYAPISLGKYTQACGAYRNVKGAAWSVWTV